MRLEISSRQIARREKRDARKERSERAFSLVEAMIASGLLGFVVLSLYGAFSFGFMTIRASQEDIRANQILMQKVETIRVYHWSKIFTNGYLPDTFQAGYSVSNGVTNGVIFDGTI